MRRGQSSVLMLARARQPKTAAPALCPRAACAVSAETPSRVSDLFWHQLATTQLTVKAILFGSGWQRQRARDAPGGLCAQRPVLLLLGRPQRPGGAAARAGQPGGAALAHGRQSRGEMAVYRMYCVDPHKNVRSHGRSYVSSTVWRGVTPIDQSGGAALAREHQGRGETVIISC